jgi:5-methylcytosine-specific restriction protein A
MATWSKPVYKKLAASELGEAGHTSGIVPTKETKDYFSTSTEATQIFVDFWSDDHSSIFKVNVNYHDTATHRDQIHLTGNLLPAYRRLGAEKGDVMIFWRSDDDPRSFKAELVRRGSARWEEAGGDQAFAKAGGQIELQPLGNEGGVTVSEEYEEIAEIDESISEKDFPTEARRGRRRVGERFVTARSKAKGDYVLKLQSYKCQVDPGHASFISKAGLPYMEKHHLISMMFYEEYSVELDDIRNIVSLCPTCHRKIHLGQPAEVAVMLEKLHAQQEAGLAEAGLAISLDELKKRYGIA